MTSKEFLEVRWKKENDKLSLVYEVIGVCDGVDEEVVELDDN
jgi:hypothetical protein